MEKMFKYKMVDRDSCRRCGRIETYKHLLWECGEAQRIWQLFNEFLSSINQLEEKVLGYENVFKIGNNANMNKTKIRIIKGMIQIERPANWKLDNIRKMANDIKDMEKYNVKNKLGTSK
jgi:hypothetical protein